jgi:hypothetical protein
MVITEKEGIGDAIRSMDRVERPPVELKPVSREIALVIDGIEKSSKRPTLSEIARGILEEAGKEIQKQPLVEPSAVVTKFGNRLIQVQEKLEGEKRITAAEINGHRLIVELHGLIEAGYIYIKDEGELNDKKMVFRLTSKVKDHEGNVMFNLTPDAKKEIGTFEKPPPEVV